MKLIFIIMLAQLFFVIFSKEISDYIQCNSTCKTCDGTGEDDCTSCDENNILIPSKSNGGYSCQLNCPTQSGYFEQEGKCQLCDIKKCSTCKGASEFDCLSCTAPFVKHENQETLLSTCIEACPIGYYVENRECKKCPINCLLCSSLDKCVLCEYSYNLENLECKKSWNGSGKGWIIFIVIIIISLIIGGLIFMARRFKKGNISFFKNRENALLDNN